MALILKFMEGPLRGKAVTIRRSITIGRQGTDIALEDPKVSKIHAFIKIDANGHWTLMDNQSRNGVRSQGKKLAVINLNEGTRFAIGKSLVQCTFSRKTLQNPGALIDAPFIQWIKEVESVVENLEMNAQLITPSIRLKVIEGHQLDQVWSLDYGPRSMGKNNTDLCLFDESLPEEVLRIVVSNGQPLLETNFPNHVKINGKAQTNVTLVHGDLIQVGLSKIQVEMDI